MAEGFRFVIRPAGPRLADAAGRGELHGNPYAADAIFADRILHGGARAGLADGLDGIGALAAALMLASRRDIKGLGRWVSLRPWIRAGLVAFSFRGSSGLNGHLALCGFAMMIRWDLPTRSFRACAGPVARPCDVGLLDDVHGMAPFGALLAARVASRLGAPLTVAGGGHLDAGRSISGCGGRDSCACAQADCGAADGRRRPAQEMTGGSVELEPEE